MLPKVANQPIRHTETEKAQSPQQAVADIFAQGFSSEQLTRSIAQLKTDRSVSVEDLDFIDAVLARAGVAA